MENQHSLPNRPRRGWVAVVLAFVNPALTMLYVGRPLRSVVYFILTLVPAAAAFVLARKGWWPAGLSWIPIAYLVPLIAAVDGYRRATAHGTTFYGGWHTTWKGLVAIAVALVALILGVRAFLFEPFRQPSASMLPTLHEGDQFFVSKPALWTSPPQRGDVITFRLPEDETITYVKRLIGLPGDVVVYDERSRRVTINGVDTGVEPVGAYTADPTLDLVRETIDGRSHLQAFMRARPSRGGTYRVPDGHYFVLGDNRDNSRDSRFEGVEYVPAGNVTGKAVFIWWNTDEPERAGTSVD